jgi:predicted TIM-barrel fold metal-dependent hydrolase
MIAIRPSDEFPLIVSTDDHLVEPPDLWTSRLPKKYRDVGPHIVYAPIDGTPVLDGAMYIEQPGTTGREVPWWNYEDHWYSIKRMIAAVGYPPEEIGPDAVTYDEMRPGCWQPRARLDDMTLNHIAASLCFPNYPRFAGQIFLRATDKELALLCVKAYNDFMVEEWCADSGGRLIPLCLVPLWDVPLAVAEVRRNAARGVRAVAFSECPAWLDLPSIHSGAWDPFFAACAETGTVVCMHIGSGTRTTRTSADAPDAVQATSIFMNSAASMIDYLFSGILARYPALQLFYAEAQIGWIPYVLERVDDVWRTHKWSLRDDAGEPPSTYYYRQMYSCFFKDSVGIDLLDRLGRDNIMFETDYPHQDGTWPDSAAVAYGLLGHLEPETIQKIVQGNAVRLFGIELPGVSAA